MTGAEDMGWTAAGAEGTRRNENGEPDSGRIREPTGAETTGPGEGVQSTGPAWVIAGVVQVFRTAKKMTGASAMKTTGTEEAVPTSVPGRGAAPHLQSASPSTSSWRSVSDTCKTAEHRTRSAVTGKP